MAEQETKPCPACGETILSVAKICKHCGSMIEGPEPSQNVVVTGIDSFSKLHTPIAGKKKGQLTIPGYLGIVLGVSLILLFVRSIGQSAPDQAEGPVLGLWSELES